MTTPTNDTSPLRFIGSATVLLRYGALTISCCSRTFMAIISIRCRTQSR